MTTEDRSSSGPWVGYHHLGMMSITLFWRHSFRLAIFYVALAALLTFIFFRSRKIAFAMVALLFLIVNVGLTALFHPTPGGVLITLGSIAAMFCAGCLGCKKVSAPQATGLEDAL